MNAQREIDVFPFDEFEQLREARAIVRDAAAALVELSRRLDSSFCAAVDLITACRGTVVVTTTQAPRVAEIHIDEVRTPGTTPVTIEFRANPTPPVVPAYASAPGFRHLISVIAP